MGELGIIPLEVRNQVLLCKWNLRFGRDKEVLWKKFLVARYGVEDIDEWDLGENVEKYGLLLIKSWWRIGRGKGRVGSILKGKLRLLVGRRDKTLLWIDLWVGERPFNFWIDQNRQYKVRDCYKVEERFLT